MSKPAMDVEQEARALGWVPETEFRGAPERWVDAETFVERGKNVMPVLRRNNERLEGVLASQAAEIARLKQQVAGNASTVEELRTVYAETLRMRLEEQKKSILAGLREAREEGDTEREDKLQDELSEVRADLRTAETQQPPKAAAAARTDAPSADVLHPDFLQWQKDNPWFGVDQRKTLKAMGIAQQLRADPANDQIVGRPFYDKILEEIEGRSAAPSKVSAARTTGEAGGGGGSKTFASLPADAREACASRTRKMVGEGKPFKTEAEWQKHYANIYFQEA